MKNATKCKWTWHARAPLRGCQANSLFNDSLRFSHHYFYFSVSHDGLDKAAASYCIRLRRKSESKSALDTVSFTSRDCKTHSICREIKLDRWIEKLSFSKTRSVKSGPQRWMHKKNKRICGLQKPFHLTLCSAVDLKWQWTCWALRWLLHYASRPAAAIESSKYKNKTSSALPNETTMGDGIKEIYNTERENAPGRTPS